MDDKPRIILDLCGGTGAWSRPYKEAGHDVRLITLPEYDITKAVFDARGWVRFPPQNRELRLTDDIPYSAISGILAAPPCTEFSIAKGGRPRELRGGMTTVEACMKVIWEAQLHTRLDFWALENPRGLLRRFLGIPNYTFEQWQFGETKIKATDIWGYFNPPTPTVKKRPDDMSVTHPNGRVNARDWTKCEHPPEYTAYINQFKGDAKRAAARAITPAGFAKAFYRANKPQAREVEA